jgi:hypothetical protein
MDNTFRPDMEAVDRGELVSLMEPLLLGPRHREELTDFALELTRKYPTLHRDMGLGFQLQIPLARVSAVFIPQRPFDVDRVRAVTLD